MRIVHNQRRRTTGFQVIQLEPLKIPHETTKPSPANDYLTESNKGLMNILAFIKAHLQSAELVQQGHRLLDHPANHSKSAAMLGVAFGDDRLDAFAPKLLAMRFTVVAAVAIDFIGREPRR